ncbi:MAG: acetylxylan esterase [Ruminococcaceae bacterium]|nr:acetylxylan esterase [Oscillospiraceae bacterium]
MPMLDMPLEQLKTYQGINPKPADFEEYWARAIAEMKATDPQVSITPAEFQSPIADCYDLYFTGVHGARVYAKLLKPKHITGKCPAVINFHGYNGKSGSWMEYLSYVASGFVVAAMDCRGQAGKSVDVGGNTGKTTIGHIIRGLNDDPDTLMFRDIFLDTAELAGIIMDMDDVDENRVGAQGGSQGGALTIACAALEPRIKRAAPHFPFLCDYKRVWEMDMAERAYGELKTYFRENDPRHEREDEIFTKLGYIDLQFLAPRIKAKLKMFTGLMDNICPPSTQFAAYNKMTCEKEVVIYPDFGHEGLPDSGEIAYQFMLEL